MLSLLRSPAGLTRNGQAGIWYPVKTKEENMEGEGGDGEDGFFAHFFPLLLTTAFSA